jgi:hypothetical protein
MPHNAKNRVYPVLVMGVSHDLHMYDIGVLHILTQAGRAVGSACSSKVCFVHRSLIVVLIHKSKQRNIDRIEVSMS